MVLHPSDGADGPIRVVVVDGDRRVRLLLVERLARADDIVVVDHTGTIARAWRMVLAWRPDVVVAEANLPDGTVGEMWHSLHQASFTGGRIELVGLPRASSPTEERVEVDATVLKGLGDELEQEIRRVAAKGRLRA